MAEIAKAQELELTQVAMLFPPPEKLKANPTGKRRTFGPSVWGDLGVDVFGLPFGTQSKAIAGLRVHSADFWWEPEWTFGLRFGTRSSTIAGKRVHGCGSMGTQNGTGKPGVHLLLV